MERLLLSPCSPRGARARVRLVLLAATHLVAVAVAFAQASAWTVGAGEVRVLCPLTIGGSFEAKTREVTGALRAGVAPGDPLDGEIVVALESLDTGINLRNQHLREKYLEVSRGSSFARARLKDIRLQDITPEAGAGKGVFKGVLQLHGVEREVAGSVELRRSGSTTRVRASFPVELSAFGIPEPRYLGVGVKDQVMVQVSLDVASMGSGR